MARDPDPIERRKRVYKTVSTSRDEDGFVVTLDGRPARTPGGHALMVPRPGLASMIAAEWSAQGELVELADMFATRLAYAVIDHMSARRTVLIDEVVAYANSDLLCYFADAPEALVEEEIERWTPVLDWAESELGLRLNRVTGILHQPQPEQTLAGVRAIAAAMDDFALGGLAQAAGLFGSVALALALQCDRLGGEAAFELSRLDEAFQERHWGIDEEAALRSLRMRTEAMALERWFQAMR